MSDGPLFAILRRLRAPYLGLAILTLNSLLLLAAAEGICRRAQRPREPAAADFSDPVDELRSLREIRTAYQPYVLWRRRPYAGRFITIDRRGLRVTPGAACVPGALVVHFYGGSTIWGAGVDDRHTIPALVQGILGGRLERPVCVVNFGQPAYVSTQEVIQLLLGLQRGEQPDVAVFYDGINDVIAAYRNGDPWGHQNLSEIRSLFERTSEHDLLDHSACATRVRSLVRERARAAPPPAPPEGLGPAVADAYARNAASVRALAAARGFQALFLLQPVLFVDKPPSPGEARIIEGVERRLPGISDLFRATYRSLRLGLSRSEGALDLSSIFSERKEQVYWDSWHLVEQGDEAVASPVAAEILRRVHGGAR